MGGIVAAVLVSLLLLGVLVFGIWFAYSRGYFDSECLPSPAVATVVRVPRPQPRLRPLWSRAVLTSCPPFFSFRNEEGVSKARAGFPAAEQLDAGRETPGRGSGVVGGARRLGRALRPARVVGCGGYRVPGALSGSVSGLSVRRATTKKVIYSQAAPRSEVRVPARGRGAPGGCGELGGGGELGGWGAPCWSAADRVSPFPGRVQADLVLPSVSAPSAGLAPAPDSGPGVSVASQKALLVSWPPTGAPTAVAARGGF